MNVFEQKATIQSWDDDYYHPIAVRLYDRAIPDMLELLGVKRGDTILDAGCGPGVHSIRVASIGFKVISIDISRSMLAEAERRVAAAGLSERVTFRQEDLTRLSIESGSIPYAFSWGVIIHIPDASKALDELARIMAPRGRLALYITNQDSLDDRLEAAARFVLRKPLRKEHFELGQGNWYEMHGERLWVWQFNIPELIRQMQRRGLRLLHRRTGELSEIQRRVPSFLRPPLLYLNNIYYRAALSPTVASANLLVFEKEKA